MNRGVFRTKTKPSDSCYWIDFRLWIVGNIQVYKFYSRKPKCTAFSYFYCDSRAKLDDAIRNQLFHFSNHVIPH